MAIVGAGIGGLCAGAILNTLYGKKVGIYESHYLPGGCAHAFDRVAKTPNTTPEGSSTSTTFTFDSGPTIVLGCSAEPYNPLRQVLNAVGLGEEVDWIRYDGWGMIEWPSDNDSGSSSGGGGGGGGERKEERRWKLEVGPNVFEDGPLSQFTSDPSAARLEFDELRRVTKPLVAGAVSIPAMAMRPGPSALVPLLRYLPALVGLIAQGELTTGTFAPFMNGPEYEVKDPWLRNWLDALAFSLSGLPAARTSAAAMAYVLYDVHREGAALDYPRGGLGAVIDALVKGVEQGGNGNEGSSVNLRSHVENIDFEDGRATGLTLRAKGGKRKIVKAREGVICNAPVWSLKDLIKDEDRQMLGGILRAEEKDAKDLNESWIPSSLSGNNGARSVLRSMSVSEERKERNNAGVGVDVKPSTPPNAAITIEACDEAEMTGSFLHLHLALNATGLDMDKMEPHYTVMDRGLEGDNNDDGSSTIIDGPCGEQNMIAVSNPCVLDRNLAPPGYILVHAYGAGNEPYHLWQNVERGSDEYEALKQKRAAVLWRAVESIIPDARSRAVVEEVGSPLTHERFLRRPKGTYGSATEDYFKDGSTAVENFVLCGDGVFPGIGIPAVALSGASAANAMVGLWEQWKCLDGLKRDGVLR